MPFNANPDLMVTDLGDELMLVNALNGEVFRMNASARLLWRRLPAEASELADCLVSTFEVSQERAAEDCAVLLRRWSEQGLVSTPEA